MRSYVVCSWHQRHNPAIRVYVSCKSSSLNDSPYLILTSPITTVQRPTGTLMLRQTASEARSGIQSDLGAYHKGPHFYIIGGLQHLAT